MIPLCITDLLIKILFSKVDQTVEKYIQRISNILDSPEKKLDFSDLLENEIQETKAQIEQVGMPAETSSEYV